MICARPKCLRASDRVKHLSVSARVTEHTERGIFLLRVIKAEREERDLILVFSKAIGIGRTKLLPSLHTFVVSLSSLLIR